MKLLIVDDNSDDVFLIQRALSQYFGAMQAALWAHDQVSMQDGLAQQPDAILCDYHIPGFEWPAALRLAQATGPMPAFIVFSGSITDDRGLAAITEGADDYVSKDNFEHLGPALERVLKNRAVFDANQQTADQVVRKAGTGPLSGKSA